MIDLERHVAVDLEGTEMAVVITPTGEDPVWPPMVLKGIREAGWKVESHLHHYPGAPIEGEPGMSRVDWRDIARALAEVLTDNGDRQAALDRYATGEMTESMRSTERER